MLDSIGSPLLWTVTIAILLVLRNSIGNVFNNAATQLNNAPTSPYP